MSTKISNSYGVQVWCGLQEGYESSKTHSIKELESFVQKYVNKVKCCVTVTPTKFIYVDGQESGAVIGFISYPRYPEEPEVIREKAFGLAKLLLKEFKQHRVTVTTSRKSYMFENEKLK